MSFIRFPELTHFTLFCTLTSSSLLSLEPGIYHSIPRICEFDDDSLTAPHFLGTENQIQGIAHGGHT